jgi:ABC-2 type transport system ATP-binding protein
MAVIEAGAVRKDFGKFRALDDVSITVEEGEFFGLLGPNGAGKTTLMRILTGQLKQDSGNVLVLGRSNDDPVEVKIDTGIVPEAESPPSFLTSQEYLELVCKLRGKGHVKDRVDIWFKFFDMEDKRDVLCKDLSKGQRQKVMLASAFIHEPRLLFLDEPFINLDPIYQKKVREYLKNLQKKGRTIFMCTHILDMAERLCTRVAVINKGKIVVKGPLTQIRRTGKEGLEEIFMRLVEGD